MGPEEACRTSGRSGDWSVSRPKRSNGEVMLTGLYAKLIIAGVILAAIVGYGEWRNNAGFNKSEALWTAKYNQRENDLIRQSMAETERQRSANEAAKALEVERIAQLEADNEKLSQLIKDLSDEADKDPAANSGGLSDSARLRINKVR
ncbi:hypothetical protein LJR231_003447 [Phyllobacterium sp. LjRoot231]|uniref:hypothetical protein n=1 Tax=Phyllobacterium sp. LjRoot231 TaxID=3342289 RepID=UPI003ECF87FC